MIKNRCVKQKHKKINKHFSIILNQEKAKILNFKIESHSDNFDKNEYKTIELITKIPNNNFRDRKVNIIIEKDNTVFEIFGTFYGCFSQVGLKRYIYKIESYIEKIKEK